ncbi:MAG TPA: phosphohydrolase [Acetobacteraceae bacterium]|nr:phosphohydrolase [Acetobacteraceae bacterium]
MSPRAWVLLPSGKRLDLLDPTPFDWSDDDLALGLARTYRWGGHSAWPLPLSVAQHSLTVLAIRRQGRARLDPPRELRELLHDADEGLLGFDAITPIKPLLGAGFAGLSARLSVAIWRRYGLPAWTPDERAAHKRADRVAAASEAIHVVGWSLEEVRASLGIATKPLARDPTPRPNGAAPWEPWSPEISARLFLTELHRLLSRVPEPQRSSTGRLARTEGR